MTTTPVLDAAHAWHAAGTSIIPVSPDGTKKPSVPWKQYQSEPPTVDQINRWWADGTAGIGAICGSVSGNLEMLELEGRAITEGILADLAAGFTDHGMDSLWRTIAGGYMEQSPSGGLHILYRVDGPAAPNTKLARRPSTADELAAHPGARLQVLIETRGEGGYVIVAPTPGTCHPSEKPWTALVGTPATIPTISVEQRDAVFAIAATLDAMPDANDSGNQAANIPGNIPARTDGRLRPGDDYNNRATWKEILEPEGWTCMGRLGRGLKWCRPGKRPADGMSATTGMADDKDRLYVFTTSTLFESERPYDKFSAYTLIHHNGDFQAATKALAAQGYGEQLTLVPDTPAITLNGKAIRAAEPVGISDRLPPASDGANALAPVVDIDTHMAPQRSTSTGWTDLTNATLLAQRHSADLRWIPSRRMWMTWEQYRWRLADDDGPAIQAAADTLAHIDIPDGKAGEAVTQHINRSRSKRGLSAMASLASSFPDMRVAAEDLDADGWMLNTPAGIVDLRTGAIRPGTPQDLCTRSSSVGPDMDMPTPRWDAFLSQTFDNNTDMISFVQRLAGYSACGVITHHVLPFLHGAGGNGKSVMLDVLIRALGDYATTAPANFLMSGRQDESAIARLSGQRLVVCSEISQQARFDEAKVKLITGGDRLTARFLYGQYFDFSPTHHLWLMGNHQPRVEAGGESFWRRLRLVPFNSTVPKERRIEDLAEILVSEEGPGILAWIIRGAIDDHRQGLAEPDSVMAATAEYAAEEDAFGRFIADRFILGGNDLCKVRTSEFRKVYEAWCRDQGDAPVSNQILVRELRSRWGIGTSKSHGIRYYTHVTLAADEEDDEQENSQWGDR